MRFAIELTAFVAKSAVIEKIRSPNALHCIWLGKSGDDRAGTFIRNFNTGTATAARTIINDLPLARLFEKLNRRSNLTALRAERPKFMRWALVFQGVFDRIGENSLSGFVNSAR